MLNRIRVGFCAGAAAMALAGAAHADMSGMVGNTILLNGANNTVIKVQLHSDGTYQTVIGGGPTIKGTWKDNNGQLCYHQTDPAPPAGQSGDFCAPGMNSRKVGDTWTQQGPGGQMTGSVVAGQ
jgi:hypothetical protein